MKRTLITLIALLILGQVFAYSILDRYSGDQIRSLDARGAAMGGSGTADATNIFAADLNPANLGWLNFSYGGQFAVGIMKNDDNRSLPMYNFFDGYIDDATYVSNVNYFDQLAAAVYYSRNFKDMKVSGAISWKPYNNFECYYEEEVRNDEGSDFNNYPPIIAKNYIEGEGTINSLAFTAAFTYRSLLAFGFEAAKLTGDQNLQRKINWSDYAEQTVDDLPLLMEEIDREFDEMGFKFGLQGRVSPRISLGFSYLPSVEFSQDEVFSTIDTSYTYESELIIPSSYRLGVTYKPRNIMRTTFNVDVEVTNWQDVNDLYETALDYYVGVEHRLNNKMPLRFGFRYNQDYRTVYEDDFAYSDKITGPTFSAGTGFLFMDNFHIDISGEYTYRKYEALDLFMDSYYNYPEFWNEIEPADRGWENPDQVSESFLNIITSISYKW